MDFGKSSCESHPNFAVPTTSFSVVIHSPKLGTPSNRLSSIETSFLNSNLKSTTMFLAESVFQNTRFFLFSLSKNTLARKESGLTARRTLGLEGLLFTPQVSQLLPEIRHQFIWRISHSSIGFHR